MTLVGFIVLVLIVGVILWALPQFPIDATLLRIVRVVLIVVIAIVAILFLASIFGYESGLQLR
jgi:hypothetical protein